MADKSAPKSDTEEDQICVVEEKVVRENGEVSFLRYSKGKFLGKGGLARCYEFLSLENGKVTAAKVVPKTSLSKARTKQKLMSEINIHRALRHPNVMGFERFFEDSENIYILLEICTNQTMSELLRRRKRLTELEVQCYMLQLLSGVEYLHQHRVIHRDLKLGNLFLSEEMEIKIGGFGSATKLEFDGERKRTICGTQNYIAPEVLDGQAGHSYEVDIWAIGVILYTLLVGKSPFETSDVKTTYQRIRMNAYTFPETVQLSESVKSLISHTLVRDPAGRLSLDDILNHPFFHQGNIIPKLLPLSTLACPPSSSYMQQFLQTTTQPSPRRMVDTVPSSALVTDSIFSAQGNFEMLNAERPRDSEEIRTREEVPAEFVKSSAEVWVKKWVDHSSKSGLGYLLSNGTTGVYFNDSSKLVLNANGSLFHYFERRESDREESVAAYFLTDYPKELQKKVTLLTHFLSYFEGDLRQETILLDPENPQKTPVYIKKWMKTPHAILFRLTNKIVQVSFQDHTEIIISRETKIVTYVNAVGERSFYPLQTTLERSNTEMSERLQYAKDILSQMKSGEGTDATSSRGGSAISDRP